MPALRMRRDRFRARDSRRVAHISFLVFPKPYKKTFKQEPRYATGFTFRQ
jgi:hypothetical protein